MKHLISLMAFLFVMPALAAPEPDLWDRWMPETSFTTELPDHAPWDRFLKTYVIAGGDGINRVDYAVAKRDAAGELDAYVAHLGDIRPTALSRAQAKAYWINLYNALTIQVVLRHYPVTSIREIDISPGLFSHGPWGGELIEVEGIALTLDDIEHRILRPIWQDTRIHYGVNCASIGCPNLQRDAYQPDNLDAQLDAAARAFVNHPRAARLEGGELVVSSIYDWFEVDFGDSEQGVIAHLQIFADAPLLSMLKGRRTIDDDSYDWALNDFRTAR